MRDTYVGWGFTDSNIGFCELLLKPKMMFLDIFLGGNVGLSRFKKSEVWIGIFNIFFYTINLRF
jgi:hypothetical protein